MSSPRVVAEKLVLKNRMNMDYFLRNDVDKYLKEYPELDLIYRTKGVVRAVRSFYRLITQLKGTGHVALLKLAKTLER